MLGWGQMAEALIQARPTSRISWPCSYASTSMQRYVVCWTPIPRSDAICRTRRRWVCAFARTRLCFLVTWMVAGTVQETGGETESGRGCLIGKPVMMSAGCRAEGEVKDG